LDGLDVRKFLEFSVKYPARMPIPAKASAKTTLRKVRKGRPAFPL